MQIDTLLPSPVTTPLYVLLSACRYQRWVNNRISSTSSGQALPGLTLRTGHVRGQTPRHTYTRTTENALFKHNTRVCTAVFTVFCVNLLAFQNLEQVREGIQNTNITSRAKKWCTHPVVRWKTRENTGNKRSLKVHAVKSSSTWLERRHH